MNRLDKWREQRDQIANDVRHVVEAGQRVLVELGQDAGAKLAGRKSPLGGRPRRRRGGRRKGFKMSAAARRRISAAQKKRWAKQRAEEKG
jgi:hypothetical protein